MAVELVLATVLWTFPVAILIGYYAAGYHLRRLAQTESCGRYPQYIQDAVDRYEQNNKYAVEMYANDDK